MSILKMLKSFLGRIFKTNTKKLSEPQKMENQNTQFKSSEKNDSFKELIKVHLNETEIETLECINDGLGFQKIKNY